MNELKLIKGDPIDLSNGFKVHPLTLGEIADIGEDVYNSYLSVIMTNKSILNNLSENDITKEELNELYKLTDLEFILYLAVHNHTILLTLINSLETFLKCGVEIGRDIGIVLKSEDKECFLENELFNEIKAIIIKQNFLKDNESSAFKPANAKAKALLEKMMKAKEKIQKQNNEEGLSLKDIISIVAAYSNDINIISVWKLTVYQLYESYLRLTLWDDYHNKFLLLPHTADSKSLDLTHWATNINKINK